MVEEVRASNISVCSGSAAGTELNSYRRIEHLSLTWKSSVQRTVVRELAVNTPEIKGEIQPALLSKMISPFCLSVPMTITEITYPVPALVQGSFLF